MVHVFKEWTGPKEGSARSQTVWLHRIWVLHGAKASPTMGFREVLPWTSDPGFCRAAGHEVDQGRNIEKREEDEACSDHLVFWTSWDIPPSSSRTTRGAGLRPSSTLIHSSFLRADASVFLGHHCGQPGCTSYFMNRNGKYSSGAYIHRY